MEEDNSKKQGISCRSLSCFILIILSVCFLSVFFIIFSKPPAIWEIIVDYNNKDGGLNYELEITKEEAQELIESQIDEIGENVIEIPEDYVSVLARDSFSELKNLTVDMEEDKMKLYWSIEQIETPKPLIGYAEIRKNIDNELYVEQLGTPRFRLPRALNNSLSTAALAVFSFGEEKAENNNLLYKILSADDSVQINDVNFKEDVLEIIINVEVRLYD